MSEEIQAEARRELEVLRAARGQQPRVPHSLGLLFPPTPGVALPEGERSHLLPVPLEEWAATTDRWDDEGPPPTR